MHVQLRGARGDEFPVAVGHCVPRLRGSQQLPEEVKKAGWGPKKIKNYKPNVKKKKKARFEVAEFAPPGNIRRYFWGESPFGHCDPPAWQQPWPSHEEGCEKIWGRGLHPVQGAPGDTGSESGP